MYKAHLLPWHGQGPPKVAVVKTLKATSIHHRVLQATYIAGCMNTVWVLSADSWLTICGEWKSMPLLWSKMRDGSFQEWGCHWMLQNPPLFSLWIFHHCTYMTACRSDNVSAWVKSYVHGGGGRGAGVYVLGQAGGNCMGWQHYVYESVV